MISVETHSSYYLKLVTPQLNYFFSVSFGWICKGMPFEYKSTVTDKNEISRLEILVHAHADEYQLKQFNAYLSAKKLQVKAQ
jgi:hypothetical protein